jgi:hypothetical protein
MKTIKFTDQELDSMIEMYTAEMEEAQLYIAHIREVLKKLGATPVKTEIPEKEKTGKKRGPKPAVKKAEKKQLVPKPAVKRKADMKLAATVESVVASLQAKEPVKEVKKAAVKKIAAKKKKPAKVIAPKTDTP